MKKICEMDVEFTFVQGGGCSASRFPEIVNRK